MKKLEDSKALYIPYICCLQLYELKDRIPPCIAFNIFFAIRNVNVHMEFQQFNP